MHGEFRGSGRKEVQRDIDYDAGEDRRAAGKVDVVADEFHPRGRNRCMRFPEEDEREIRERKEKQERACGMEIRYGPLDVGGVLRRDRKERETDRGEGSNAPGDEICECVASV